MKQLEVRGKKRGQGDPLCCKDTRKLTETILISLGLLRGEFFCFRNRRTLSWTAGNCFFSHWSEQSWVKLKMLIPYILIGRNNFECTWNGSFLISLWSEQSLVQLKCLFPISRNNISWNVKFPILQLFGIILSLDDLLSCFPVGCTDLECKWCYFLTFLLVGTIFSVAGNSRILSDS